MRLSILFLTVVLFSNHTVFSENYSNSQILQDTLPPVVSVMISKLHGFVNNSGEEEKHKDVRLSASSASYTTYLELGFQLKEDLGCTPGYWGIEKLADAMKLTDKDKFKYNQDCSFDRGDLTSYSKKGRPVDQLILEFATIRLALEALEEKKFTLVPKNRSENLQGILSAIAREFKGVIALQNQWAELRKKYKDCQENDPMISIPIELRNQKKTAIFYIKAFRIEDVKNKIVNAPEGEFSIGHLQTLAKYYGLPGFGVEYNCNPALWFTEDDLMYFFNELKDEKNNLIKIHKELASRAIIFDAADFDNLPCIRFNNLGDISYVAEEFIIPKL